MVRTGCCMNPTVVTYDPTGRIVFQRGYETDIDNGGTVRDRQQFLTNNRIRIDQTRAKVWSIGCEANRSTSQSPPQLMRATLTGTQDLRIHDFACVCFDVGPDGGIVAFGNAGGPTNSSWATASGWKWWFFDVDGNATGSCTPATSPTSLSLQSNLTVYSLPGGDLLAGWVDTGTLAFKLCRFTRAGATVWIRTAPTGATAVICGVTSTRFLTIKGDVLDLSDGTTVGTFNTVAPLDSSLICGPGIGVGDQLPIVFAASTATPSTGVAVLNLSTLAIDQLWTNEAAYSLSVLTPPPNTYGWPSDPTGRASMDGSYVFASRNQIDGSGSHGAHVIAIDRGTNLIAWEQTRKAYGVDTDVDGNGNVHTAGPLVARIMQGELL